MDKVLYNAIINYFKSLSYTGYKSYDVVYKILIIDFINQLSQYCLFQEDKDLIKNFLNNIIESTCEIDFPEEDFYSTCF